MGWGGGGGVRVVRGGFEVCVTIVVHFITVLCLSSSIHMAYLYYMYLKMSFVFRYISITYVIVHIAMFFN